MTDKLTPGMLRDLADIIDAIPSGEYGAPHFREEAARREAEAKPTKPCPRLNPPVCLHPEACVTECALSKPATALSIGEREGPGSAAAPFKPHKACKTYDRCRRDGFCEDAWNCSEDKPAPAADAMLAARKKEKPDAE